MENHQANKIGGATHRLPQALRHHQSRYHESYADRHATLNRDTAIQEKVRNVARAVAEAVGRQGSGTLTPPDAGQNERTGGALGHIVN